MTIEKSDAIVIRTVDFSESSLVLELFSRDFGKIRGIAKGARRLKNSFDSALDLLTRISLSFIRKNSDALDLLTEAKLITRFHTRRSGLPGLYAGCYLAELLQMTTEEGEALPELYDLAVETLAGFEEGVRIEENLWRFQWCLLENLGERPSMETCIVCGTPISFEDEIRFGRNVGFALLDGGTVCADCRQREVFKQLVSVDPRAAARISRYSTGEPLPSPEPMSSRVVSDIRGLTDWVINTKCGRKPKLQETVRNALKEVYQQKSE